MNDVTLERQGSIRELGLFVDLSFPRPVEKTINRALQMLGFIFRISKQLKNTNVIRSLYLSYINSHLGILV